MTARPAIRGPLLGLAAGLAAWAFATACVSPGTAGAAARPVAPDAPSAPASAPVTPADAAEGAPVAPAPAPAAWPEPDRTQPPWSQTPIAPIAPGAVQRDRVERGEHLRIGTDHGVVHVWRPRGYRHRRAGTVIYLHGYYTDVDQAWADHRLAGQFRKSGRNALFLAIEAPSWNGEAPFWPSLDELFEAVDRIAGVKAPAGPLVVAGHSGGFRGIVPWLVDPRIAEVLLLDGLYQGERTWAEWLDGAPRGQRRLVLVGLETAARSEAWLPSRPDALALPRVPPPERRLRKKERTAPILYMHSQHDHMALIEQGQVLPLLLRDGRLRAHAVGAP